MLTRSRSGFFSAPVVMLLASSALAASPLQKIDPNFIRATRTGIATASTRVHVPQRAAAMIELDHPATPADFVRLRASGVELVVADGIPIAYDRFVAVRLDERAAKAIAPFPDLRRISLSAHPARLPLDHSAELIRLDDARGSRPAMERLTGQGITIADEDSPSQAKRSRSAFRRSLITASRSVPRRTMSVTRPTRNTISDSM